jgi:uncharacterized protein YggE
MNRRQLLLGTAAVGTTALTGCLASAQTPDSDGRTVTVTGVAETTAAPDRAILTASVEATGESAAAVRDDLSARSETLRAALLDAGVDEADLTTDRFSIRERRDPERADGSMSAPQYEGTSAFRIEVPQVEATGDIIDAAVDGGADSIDRIEYTLSTSTRRARREEALATALSNARREAAVLAAETDTTVIEAQHIDASGGGFSPAYAAFETADAAGGQSTTLEPGDVTVRATVEVTYRVG